MDKYGEGIKGEELAKKYLIEKGYEIIAQNVNYPNVGELDIVAMQGGILVFVEVRTRSDNVFGHPFETFTKTKINKVVKASRRFLMDHKIRCSGYRYDAIAVFRGRVEHIESAFFAHW
ncbi:MAG: YraN family protein [Clostridia bacterium]|nr:YraN family protein [Clostridia bacterium]